MTHKIHGNQYKENVFKSEKTYAVKFFTLTAIANMDKAKIKYLNCVAPKIVLKQQVKKQHNKRAT